MACIIVLKSCRQFGFWMTTLPSPVSLLSLISMFLIWNCEYVIIITAFQYLNFLLNLDTIVSPLCFISLLSKFQKWSRCCYDHRACCSFREQIDFIWWNNSYKSIAISPGFILCLCYCCIALFRRMWLYYNNLGNHLATT